MELGNIELSLKLVTVNVRCAGQSVVEVWVASTCSQLLWVRERWPAGVRVHHHG